MTDNESEALSKLVEAGNIMSKLVDILAERVSRLEKDVRNLKDPHYHPEYYS